MNRGENSDSIPTDLILDILSRLPSKSIGKFLCVSKLWESMLRGPLFSELFLTRSSARPRLLFAIQHRYLEWRFYSTSSLEVTTDFHTKFISECNFSYVCGLIYFPKMRIPKEDKEAERVICNPITGQCKILPELRTEIYFYSYLGFDPIDKQFKLLVMSTSSYIAYPNSVHHILTLGDEKLMRWRKIQCPFTHEPLSQRTCINGVLYYLAYHSDEGISYVIFFFDVRSEIFKFLDSPSPPGYIYLINYKGKLGAISLTNAYDSGMSVIKLSMWVLEDVEKQEWSKYVYTLPEDVISDSYSISVAGVTVRGEIVMLKKRQPFDVFYFDTERNTLQCDAKYGNHQEVEDQTCVYAFVDHVEDLNFDIMKTTRAATSIRPPEQTHIPTTTSTREDHQVKTTSTSSRKDHQVAHHPQQDRRTIESINRYNALCLLDDDEFTGDKTCENDTSRLQVEDEFKDHSLKLSSSRSDTPTHKQTMKSFKLKNEKAITQGVANGSRYKEADKSCKVISGRLKGTDITAVVVAAAGAVAAVVLFSNPEVTTKLMNLVYSYVNAIITAFMN